MLGEALRQQRLWQQTGLELTVAVNISAHNIMDVKLVEQITAQLKQHGVAPQQLILELTESAFMHEPERCFAVLKQLDAEGIRLAIDDFGTGYSSLAYLKELPICELKIDKGFVLDMLENSNDAKIVASTIALAHTLGLQVVAERVESLAAREALAELGCDLIQGYYITRPLPAEELAAWLESSS